MTTASDSLQMFQHHRTISVCKNRGWPGGVQAMETSSEEQAGAAQQRGTKMGSEDGARKWDVFRLGNLLRMAVVWILCLFYSYIQYHVIRLQLPHRKHEFQSLDFRFRSSQEPKPACIVTGASSGLGRETASALAQRGFHVILAGRSLERLEVVRAEIQTQSSSASCQALAVDLTSVPSILSFTRTVKELFESHDSPGTLQLLVNNAGVIAASQRWTEDDCDVTMASNYIGHYILTHELLPLLQKNAPQARIVNLVSFTHRALQRDQIDVSQLRNGGIQQKPADRSYYPLAKIYETSKLFLILFSYELHRRGFSNTEHKDRVSVMAADPGFASTNLLREVPNWLVQLSFIVMRLLRLWQSPTAGASSVVAAATAPWEVSGKYVFGNQGLFCKSTSLTYDEQLGRSLWEASEGICTELIDKHSKYD
ncbi:hypothetical protein M758_1G148800 [Ceratodon purpureus]|nr:hypothetical protein M758_1G148800 [Ceratodon purpureus]